MGGGIIEGLAGTDGGRTGAVVAAGAADSSAAPSLASTSGVTEEGVSFDSATDWTPFTF